ncbi:MAG: 4-hydroxy-3-methylbut-2-enyl diphosphate reductase [Patescibacteria group bacterium]|nr:4-hydroxy-3-methylbut-2-enyl diphosphate reductase [Patescibacteria group bacterium]
MVTIKNKQLLVAEKRSFCMGVQRAVDMLEKVAKEANGKPVYCVHEIVHNPTVVKLFHRLGVQFIDSVEELPESGEGIVVFSAHGIPFQVMKDTEAKGFTVHDATCPLVRKVYRELKDAQESNATVVYIGKPGHQEAESVKQEAHDLGVEFHLVSQGNIDSLPEGLDGDILLFTQTTLNIGKLLPFIDEIKTLYPQIQNQQQGDICYATQERQESIIDIAAKADKVIVIGGSKSSNSRELARVGGKDSRMGEGILLEHIEELDFSFLEGVSVLAFSGGASTPESDIQHAAEYLQQHYGFEL